MFSAEPLGDNLERIQRGAMKVLQELLHMEQIVLVFIIIIIIPEGMSSETSVHLHWHGCRHQLG